MLHAAKRAEYFVSIMISHNITQLTNGVLVGLLRKASNLLNNCSVHSIWFNQQSFSPQELMVSQVLFLSKTKYVAKTFVVENNIASFCFTGFFYFLVPQEWLTCCLHVNWFHKICCSRGLKPPTKSLLFCTTCEASPSFPRLAPNPAMVATGVVGRPPHAAFTRPGLASAAWWQTVCRRNAGAP